MSKLEDFEDLPYEDELKYTERELQDRLNCLKATHKEEMEKLTKELKQKALQERLSLKASLDNLISTLQKENKFYENIIKSVLHIKE